MIQPGDAFLFAFGGEKPHLWIVAAVSKARSECLIVNLTTLRHNVDQTVILQPGDHPFINKASAVFYAGAKICAVASLDEVQRRGEAERREPLKADLLKLILDGFRASEHTAQKVLDWLAKNAAR